MRNSCTDLSLAFVARSGVFLPTSRRLDRKWTPNPAGIAKRWLQVPTDMLYMEA